MYFPNNNLRFYSVKFRTFSKLNSWFQVGQNPIHVVLNIGVYSRYSLKEMDIVTYVDLCSCRCDVLTLPHFLAPKELIPLKYFEPFSPSNDKRGPPESPLHESFPEIIWNVQFANLSIL